MAAQGASICSECPHFFIPTSDTYRLNRLNHGVITSLVILLTRTLAHTMSSECPFQISVPDHALSDPRFPDEVDDAGWDYGVPLSDVKRLVNKWKEGYDWRAHERELNKLPMFTRDIEVEGFGILNIHYVHQRSEVQNAIPLLFVHGCTSAASFLLGLWD